MYTQKHDTTLSNIMIASGTTNICTKNFITKQISNFEVSITRCWNM